MRVKLCVRRHLLPPLRLLWSIDKEDSSDSCTIAEFLERVNEVIPLESSDWGLEDYVVEVQGHECLHFTPLSDILSPDDCVLIRPLTKHELRARVLSFRHQISTNGVHLVDGVPFGRHALRYGLRPAINIPSRTKSRLDSYDINLLENCPTQSYDSSALLSRKQTSGYLDYDNWPPNANSTMLNHHETSSLPERESKRSSCVRFNDSDESDDPDFKLPSKLHPACTSRNKSRNRSDHSIVSGKSINTSVSTPNSPSTLQTSRGIQNNTKLSPHHVSSGLTIQATSASTSNGGSNSDSDTNSGTSSSTASNSHSLSRTDSDSDSHQSSSQSSSSNSDPDSESSSDESSGKSFQKPMPTSSKFPVRPSERDRSAGLTLTQRRNARRRLNLRLAKLKSLGKLPANATRQDLLDYDIKTSNDIVGSTGRFKAKNSANPIKRPADDDYDGDICPRKHFKVGKSVTDNVVQSIPYQSNKTTTSLNNETSGIPDWRKKLIIDVVECATENIKVYCPTYPKTDGWNLSIREDSPNHSNHDTQNNAVVPDQIPSKNHIQPIPNVPNDVNDRPRLTLELIKPGIVIAYKELVCNETTNWAPEVSNFRSARVESVETPFSNVESSNNDSADSNLVNSRQTMVNLTLRLAPSSIPVPRVKRLDAQGRRIYQKFEMAGFEDSDDEHEAEPDEGLRQLPFTSLIEPRLLDDSCDPASSSP